MATICIGKTLSGERCAREAMHDSNYCSIHKPGGVFFGMKARKAAAKKATKKAMRRTAKKR